MHLINLMSYFSNLFNIVIDSDTVHEIQFYTKLIMFSLKKKLISFYRCLKILFLTHRHLNIIMRTRHTSTQIMSNLSVTN